MVGDSVIAVIVWRWCASSGGVVVVVVQWWCSGGVVGV